MITSSYVPPVRHEEVILKFSQKSGRDEIHITKLKNVSQYTTDQTLIVSGKNPSLLWNILYDLAKLPHPKLSLDKSTIKTESLPTLLPEKVLPMETIAEKSIPVVNDTMGLATLSAKEIVAKVKKDTGVLMTDCLKSKARILKKAQAIYANKGIESMAA